MKTRIIGALAIVIAIAASAFTAPTKSAKAGTTYYWFSITDGIATGHKVPSADATFLQESTSPPSGDCPGGSNQCISGFTSSQVNSSNELKDNNQVPAVDTETQN